MKTPDLIQINNFISKEEIDLIMNVINSATEDDWKKSYHREIYYNKGKPIPIDSDLYKERMARINEFWDDKLLPFNINEKTDALADSLTERASKVFDDMYDINELYRVQRQYPGTNLKIHNDQANNKNLLKAIIVYLNDDYKGGELFFPDYDFEIKPKAGTLISFPGDSTHEHGVKPVEDGPTRYVLSSFAFVKGSQ